MDKEKFVPEEQIRIVSDRLFKSRPAGRVELIPHTKNEAQFVDRRYWSYLENVNLYKIFPNAKEGDFCYVSFDVSSSSEDDGYIKINSDVDVYIDKKLVYTSGSGGGEMHQISDDGKERLHIPIHVSEKKQRVDIKCVCHDGKFEFDYLLSSKVYPFMWAKDYLLHIKRNLPIAEFANEDGIAVSKLFSNGETPEDIDEYVFPKSTEKNDEIDFAKISENPSAFVGYAYSEAKADTTLDIAEKSPVRVYINGSETQKPYNVKKGDKILVKSIKGNNGWGFACDDSLLTSENIISSNRQNGDKWLLLCDFGKSDAKNIKYGPEFGVKFDSLYTNEFGDKLFWRLADGSYIRPYLDTFFFGQWYYALMLGHWGILKLAKALDDEEKYNYFIDSISILANWFEYMKYDYDKLHITTPFLQRSLTLDHMDPLGTMGMNIADLYTLTNNPNALNTLNALKDALETNVPRFENGMINRIETVWADDLFMAVPLLVRLGKIYKEQKYIDDAFNQLNEYYKLLFMPERKLFSHVYYTEEKEQCGVSWGRGNGWAMVAMCEYLDNTPEDEKNRARVCEMYRTFAEGVKSYQTESGMWRNVLNVPESYEETSCTAMFLYSLQRGVKLGIIPKDEFLPVIDKAYNALNEKCIDKDGNTYGVCMGSGCGKDWHNYNLKTVKNDDHGTGIILAALSEYADLKKHENCI